MNAMMIQQLVQAGMGVAQFVLAQRQLAPLTDDEREDLIGHIVSAAEVRARQAGDDFDRALAERHARDAASAQAASTSAPAQLNEAASIQTDI